MWGEIGLEFRFPGRKNVNRFIVVGRKKRLRALIGGAGKNKSITVGIRDDANLVVIHAVWPERDLDLKPAMRNQPSKCRKPFLEKLAFGLIEHSEKFCSEPLRKRLCIFSTGHSLDVAGVRERTKDKPHRATPGDKGR